MSTTSYKPINESIWGEGGTGYAGYQTQIEKEKRYQQQTGTGSNPYTNDQMKEILAGLGVDGNSIHDFPNRQQPADGSSGADERFLSDGDFAYIQHCKEMYKKAATQEEKDRWHQEAERVRARAGYSGGTDGSLYIPLSQVGVQAVSPSEREGLGGNKVVSPSQSTAQQPSYQQPSYQQPTQSASGFMDELRAALTKWQESAAAQSDSRIDAAVQQAVTNLQQTLEDAQPKFREQAESIAWDERQAMDNSALYAELRGDRGGIGRAQYDAIQNTAAVNRNAVRAAQNQLATDTGRQIAALRAEGEFEKADAALDLTQQYLEKLVALEQWGAEFGLDTAQFQAELMQWEKEYQLALQKLQLSREQWNAEMGLKEQQFHYSVQSETNGQLAQMGKALLGAGVMPTGEQLAAMGMTASQATEQLILAQLKGALA